MGLFDGLGLDDYYEWQSLVNNGRRGDAILSKKTLLNSSNIAIDDATRIIRDCLKLINTTKTPIVFFTRYDTLLQKLYLLSRLERFVPLDYFHGTIPHEKHAEIIAMRERETNTMIDRYWESVLEDASTLKTDKARQKRIDKFFEVMNHHSDRMYQSNLDLIKSKKRFINA